MLFPNFLYDEKQYNDCENYWLDMASNIMDGQWEMFWIGTHFANGEKMRDGNPIFSAVCHSRKIAIRVLQYEAEERPPTLDWYHNYFGENDEILELVICLSLSQDTSRIAKYLMGKWVKTGEFKSKCSGD